MKEETNNSMEKLKNSIEIDCNENIIKMKDLLMDQIIKQQNQQIDVNSEIWKISIINENECKNIKSELINLTKEQEYLIRTQQKLAEKI